jgi:hypothetical protein
MEYLVVGFAAYHLVITHHRQGLSFGVGNIARRFKTDGLVVGIALLPVRFRSSVYPLVALPCAYQGRQGTVIDTADGCVVTHARILFNPLRGL